MQIESTIENRLKGERSETNFAGLVVYCFGDIVNQVVKASRQDDHRGIDFYLFMENGKKLPAQVKSSSYEVQRFKESEHFKRLNGEILVINANIREHESQFKIHFLEELIRVINLKNS